MKYLVDASVRHSANQDGVHNKHDHYFFCSDGNKNVYNEMKNMENQVVITSVQNESR